MISSMLAPLDCSPAAEAGLYWAVHAAERSRAAINLLTVVESQAPDGNGHVARAKEYLQAHRNDIEADGLVARLEVVSGPPPECILDKAAASDLTVMTYGTSRWLFGGALDLMLRKMTRPLVVVRGPSGKARRAFDTGKVLIPLDTTPYSSDALPEAQALAGALGASIILCHVITPVGPYLDPADAPPGVARIFEDLTQEARSFLSRAATGLERQGTKVEIVVAVGDASREIVRVAEQSQAGVIAMATRGIDSLSRIMGSVAYGVLQFARLPCLLVRPADTS